MSWNSRGGGWNQPGWQQQRGQQQQQQHQQFQQRVQAPMQKGMQKGGAGAVAQPVAETLVVSTGGQNMDEVVIRTLVGEYKEHGNNHNRKVYKKIIPPGAGADAVDVWIYYWDERDGEAFEGWWFGNQLGGTQVWSQNKQPSMSPPVAGWKIPWDGQVRKSMTVQPKQLGQHVTPAAAQPVQRGVNASWMPQNAALAKVREILEEIKAAEASAQTAIEQAKSVAGDYDTTEGLQNAEQLLSPQVGHLTAANKKLLENQKATSGDLGKELQTLGQKLRVTHASVNTELGKIRATKMKVARSEQQKHLEEKDTVLLQEIMPEALSKTNNAEDAVEKAAITSEMIAAGSDDIEEVRQAVDATEKAAKEAQVAIGEARIYLNAKLAAAKRFESEGVRKAAAEELGKLQALLQESQTKLTPLKTARQDFIQRQAAQKVTAELTDRLNPAEVEVDKAEEACAVLDGDGASKENLKQAEAATKKALDQIQNVMKFIELKKKATPAQGIVREELTKMEQRTQASITRLEKMKESQKEVIEKISTSTLAGEAGEKLQAVKDAVAKVADAEGPFLMGLEELPLEQTMNAVKACETAATSANTAVSIARMFIATKLVEVKRYTSAPSKEAQAKLQGLQKELEGLTKRLNDLKKATANRKKDALMRESEGSVKKAEELAAKVAEAGAVFADDAKLSEISSDDLRAAGTATAEAEKEATAALAEARKFITARQIDAKGKESSEEVSALLIKYQSRLSSAQTEVSKYKKLSATVEQRLAAKKVLEDATNRVTSAEEKLKAALDSSKELNDMSPESIGEQGYKDAVKKAEEAHAAAGTALKQVDRYLSTQVRVSSSVKDDMAKLTPKVKEAQEKLDESNKVMKERSEKLVVEVLIAESTKKVSDAEEAVEKAKEAEKPFLTGEEMAVEKAAEAIAALDTAAGAAHTTVGGSKTFLAMKRLAAKRLAEGSSKTAGEELAKLQARLDEASKKLQEVKKGMAERKSGQIKQLITAKVIGVEKKVEETTNASKDLAKIEASENFSAENAKAECEKLSSLEKEAQKLLDEGLTFLLENQKNVKGAEDEIKALQTRLTSQQTELAKAKKALSEFEQRFVAQKLLSEAKSMIKELETETEKVKASCAPLLEGGGACFLAATTVATLAEALKDHMQKTTSTREAVFKEAGNGSEKISKDLFVAYLEKLHEKLSNEDLIFPEEQREDIFKHVDADKDGEICFADFESMFQTRCICVQAITITDGYEISKAKCVVKLQIDDVVELIGEPRVSENGVSRHECRLVDTDKTGWVTMKGNQGTVYLEPYSPYTSFNKATDKAIEAVVKSVSKVNGFVKNKSNALAHTPRGPLADARKELQDLRPKVAAAQKEVETLKGQLATAKKDYVKKQGEALEAKDRKAAALLMKSIKDKVDVMDAHAKELQDLAKPLMSASDAELEAVATPLTISTEIEKAIAVLATDCQAVRSGIAEQKEAVAKAPKGPMREAKQELAKFMVKADATDRKSSSTAEAVRKACEKLAGLRKAQVSNALRGDMQKRELDVDKFFAELSAGQEKISEASFSSHVKKLDGCGLPDEHFSLMIRHIQADGIGRRSFENLVQVFFQCVKAIAITNDFTITKTKNVRMLEMSEVIEALEGPTADPKLGIERVKGRAITDGAIGWISMKGNQGTPFLKEVQKPCYYCVADVALDKELRNANGDAPLESLKAHEILEVLEGPKKDAFEGSFRAKCRAQKDSAVGWFVLKTQSGTANAEQSGQYYVCTAAIAITDVSDIKACKVIRKLDVKEVVQVLEGPVEQADAGGVSRMRCKSLKDGQEGWITIKGNKGTVYAEETSKLYTLSNDVPLHKSFESDGAVLVRQLEKGEAVEILEGPKQEKFEVMRLKARTQSSGSVGWVTVKQTTVKPWVSQYKCVAATELSAAAVTSGEAVRKIEIGEVVVYADGPQKEGDVMRLKVRAEKDSSIGWVTLKSAEGTDFFKQFRPAPEGRK